MSKEKIAITGANGYIGRHVVKQLLDLGMEVIAIDVNYEKIDTRANILVKSIFDCTEDVYEKIGKPDRLIHLAWRDGFNHNSNRHLEDLSSHYKFIKYLMESGIKSISIMGTMHEIGYWEGAIDENTPANPMSMYGIAKNALRQSSKLLAEKNQVSLKWLRGYYIVGDDVSNHSIFTKLIEKENEGANKFPFTSGKNKYDFLDVNELAEQIVRASLQDEIVNEINCCSGVPVSLGEKVEEFIKNNHFKIRLEYGAFPDRSYDSPGVWGDRSKMDSILKNSFK